MEGLLEKFLLGGVVSGDGLEDGEIEEEGDLLGGWVGLGFGFGF